MNQEPQEDRVGALAVVADIMSRDVVTATLRTPVAEIARLMADRGISGVPVVDATGRILGVVTDHDLIIRNAPIDPPPYLPLLEGRIPLETPRHFERRLRHVAGSEAADIMTGEVVSIAPEAEIEALAALMVRKRLHVVPVVVADRLVGVVTRADVLRFMAGSVGAGA